MSKKYSQNRKKRSRKKKRKTSNIAILVLVLVLFVVGVVYMKNKDKDKGTTSDVKSEYSYSVSTSNEMATKIGEEVLAKGGNAVDAAVAVAYALGVVEPYGSGIGGGGGMLIYDPSSDDYKFYDYKDIAPLSQSTQQSNVGVPGFVAGMEKVLEDYGSMDFEELIQPSIDLAKNGFKVDSDLEQVINVYSGTVMKNDAYLKNGQLLKKGDKLIQEDLGETLEYIKLKGSKGFYEDIIAKNIADKSILTLDDMKSYEVDVKEPVTGEFNGYEIISAPAPFSGTTLIQSMEIIEQLSQNKDINSANDYLEVLNVATDLSTYERVKKLADPEYVSVDHKSMTSPDYIKTLLSLGNVEYKDDSESESTTHFSIVDKDGMVVSSTNTLGHFYGSETLVDGFYLNGTLGNFAKSGINKYAPGKKPRTFTSPTIVKKGDEFTLAIGTPGGNRIVKVLTPILVDKLYFNKDLQESVNKNRVIFYSKDTIMEEDDQTREPIIDISTAQYPVIKSTDTLYFGSVQAAGIENGEYIGATDIRRPGKLSISNK